MRDIYQDVTDFHAKFGMRHSRPAPVRPNRQTREIRTRLLSEEYEELREAIRKGTLAQIGQEAVDLIYATVGLMVEAGLPFEKIWEEVHTANMRKGGVDDYGKVIKPEGWEPARVAAIVERESQDVENLFSGIFHGLLVTAIAIAVIVGVVKVVTIVFGY